MNRVRSHSLTAWLCLFALLANLVTQVGIVRCSDGHGGTKLEWSCSQNERRECVKTCGSGACQDTERPPHPCDDKPLAMDQGRVHQAPPQANLLTLPVPVLVAVIEPFWPDPPATVRTRSLCPESHPPDTLGRLRSVILTV